MSVSSVAVKVFDEAGCAMVFHNKQVKTIIPADSTVVMPGKEVLSEHLKSDGSHMTNLHDDVNTNDNSATNKTLAEPVAPFKPKGTSALTCPRFKHMGSPQHQERVQNILGYVWNSQFLLARGP